MARHSVTREEQQRLAAQRHMQQRAAEITDGRQCRRLRRLIEDARQSALDLMNLKDCANTELDLDAILAKAAEGAAVLAALSAQARQIRIARAPKRKAS